MANFVYQLLIFIMELINEKVFVYDLYLCGAACVCQS